MWLSTSIRDVSLGSEEEEERPGEGLGGEDQREEMLWLGLKGSSRGGKERSEVNVWGEEVRREVVDE